jgi:hypothetical protein
MYSIVIYNINRHDRRDLPNHRRHIQVILPQAGDVCKARNVVFHRVVVIVGRARRGAFLIKYGQELAPGGCHSPCQCADASPRANEEARRFGCSAPARRHCTGTCTSACTCPIGSFLKDDLHVIFKNSTELHMAIEKVRCIASVLKHSGGISRVWGRKCPI